MRRFLIIFSLSVFLFLGVLQSSVSGCTISNFTYEFQPKTNIYKWKADCSNKIVTVEVNYHKLPGTLIVKSTVQNTVGQPGTYHAKYKASCNEDPILYPGVTCSPCTKLEGEYKGLPDHIRNSSCNLCIIGNMLPDATRTSMRSEYEACFQGPFTLAPFPTSPKAGSSYFSPVKFEMFLPIRFCKPCTGWYFTIHLERHDPSLHIYKWKQINTKGTIKGYEGPNFECRAKRELKLAPGKYRYRLQAEHYQYGKTPWSNQFEFTVKVKMAPPVHIKPAIFVKYPNGGETLLIRDKPYIITWNYFNLPREVEHGNVKIVLRKGGSWFKLLKASTSAKRGQARIKITEDIPPGDDYKIRVRSLVESKFSDDSDSTFSINKIKVVPMKKIN